MARAESDFGLFPFLLSLGAIAALFYFLAPRAVPGRLAPGAAPRPVAAGPVPPRGSRDWVMWIQRSLNQIFRANLSVDGAMGPATVNAIRTFQGFKNLVVDGAVGPQTEAAIVQELQSPTLIYLD